MDVCFYDKSHHSFVAGIPRPRGGELFWARFFGAFAPKNRAVKFPPSPREGGLGGMVFRLNLRQTSVKRTDSFQEKELVRSDRFSGLAPAR